MPSGMWGNSAGSTRELSVLAATLLPIREADHQREQLFGLIKGKSVALVQTKPVVRQCSLTKDAYWHSRLLNSWEMSGLCSGETLEVGSQFTSQSAGPSKDSLDMQQLLSPAHAE